MQVLLAACLCAASIAAAQRPNVLLVMTDQQFGDAMSCRMGPRYLHTPAMDSLAAEGTLFTRAYSSNPLCMPLRNSLFTGRFPHETGVTANVHKDLDPEKLVSMGNYFRRAGYETAYFGKWHLCFNIKNVDAHGFEHMDAMDKKAAGGPDLRAAQGARRFLARPHERPFLLVVSFLNPHNICEYARMLGGVPGQKFNCGDVGRPASLDECPPAPFNMAPPVGEPDGMKILRRACHATQVFPVGTFTADDWRVHRWAYYRMIELVDAQLAAVLDGLRSTGTERETLVVFTSDHGDCAGAHGFNQKTVFYEESARVPLIACWKGRTAAAESDKLVNIGIDILPTMLDFADIEVPDVLPGQSLKGIILGEPAGQWRDHVVVENNMIQAGTVDGFKPQLEGRMVRSDRFKYCVYSHGQRRESLVDLKNDPGETHDLAANPEYRQVLLTHRQMLAEFGRQHNDPLAAALLRDNVKPLPYPAAK